MRHPPRQYSCQSSRRVDHRFRVSATQDCAVARPEAMGHVSIRGYASTPVFSVSSTRTGYRILNQKHFFSPTGCSNLHSAMHIHVDRNLAVAWETWVRLIVVPERDHPFWGWVPTEVLGDCGKAGRVAPGHCPGYSFAAARLLTHSGTWCARLLA
jgi:hypothetical protein